MANVKYEGIDCCVSLNNSTAPIVKETGYNFVMRYIGNFSNPKNIQSGELNALKNAGLKVGFIFESTAGRALEGAAAGTADGLTAKNAANNLGLSDDVAIYFAVDTDTSNFSALDAYGVAFKNALNGRKSGPYGSYRVIENLYATGHYDVFWQCYAWSYGAFSGHANVYQYRNGQSVGGVNVDLNHSYGNEGFEFDEHLNCDQIIDKVADNKDQWKTTIQSMIALGQKTQTFSVLQYTDKLIEKIYDYGFKGTLEWDAVVNTVASNPSDWITALNAVVSMAQADGDIGTLELVKYFKVLIVKVYEGNK